MKKQVITQTGFGFDSHSFARTGQLVLGGRKFTGLPALKGHSDGDALLHALIDSLLGAAALGDIGQLFPDNDPSIKGISSRTMVREALARLTKGGFKPLHVDLTFLGDRPKMSPVAREIRQNIAALLGIPIGKVSLKAKTPEGLQIFKAPGGVAVWSVATVSWTK